ECPGECGDETCDPDQGEDCGNCPDDCGPCGDADDDGYTSDVDCDDNDASVNPGATELCDGQDNDCDGGIPATETDSDGDGYVECSIDAGGWDGLPIFGGDDCDDTDLEVNPAAAEACNGFDDDCDGEVDEGC
nr:putative metal-binding motif-containing protein [Nanoarchaeota archaeon]